MDVCREELARSMHREDIAQPTDGMEPGSKVDIAPVLIEPNVVPPGSEQHVPSLVIPTTDAAELP